MVYNISLVIDVVRYKKPLILLGLLPAAIIAVNLFIFPYVSNFSLVLDIMSWVGYIAAVVYIFIIAKNYKESSGTLKLFMLCDLFYILAVGITFISQIKIPTS